jgi:hypothetical protein
MECRDDSGENEGEFGGDEGEKRGRIQNRAEGAKIRGTVWRGRV